MKDHSLGCTWSIAINVYIPVANNVYITSVIAEYFDTCGQLSLLIFTGFLMLYDCCTFNGSSGSPVVKVVDGKLQVVAVHRGVIRTMYYNFSTLFTSIFSHVGFDNKEGLVTLVLHLASYCMYISQYDDYLSNICVCICDWILDIRPYCHA